MNLDAMHCAFLGLEGPRDPPGTVTPEEMASNTGSPAKEARDNIHVSPSLCLPLLQVPRSSTAQVICRFRPLNDREQAEQGSVRCVEYSTDGRGVGVNTADRAKHTFGFDYVFGEDSTQEDVYAAAGRPIIAAALEGFNACLLAYGQTGSGKTHTMTGEAATKPSGEAAASAAAEGGERPALSTSAGVIPRVAKDLFDYAEYADETIEFSISVSMVEIYMERIRCLLDPSRTNLQVGEDPVRGVYLKGATEVDVVSEEELLKAMEEGNTNRAVAATGMNAGSSRSHSLFMLHLVKKDLSKGEARTSRLYLVDLAGSETVNKTGVSGQQLEEAKKINQSLSALGNVINALTDGKSMHVPYRNSKLTRVLQECLGGNARTSLVICCSPSVFNQAETLSTLRFGKRAKMIKNRARVNKERTPDQMRQYIVLLEAEIQSLKEEMSSARSGDVLDEAPSEAKGDVDSSLREQNTELVQNVKQLSSLLAEAAGEISSLKERMKENEQELVHTKEELVVERGKFSEAASRIEAAEGSGKADEELALVQAAYQRTLEDNETLRESVRESECRADTLEETLASLKRAGIVTEDMLSALETGDDEALDSVSSVNDEADRVTDVVFEQQVYVPSRGWVSASHSLVGAEHRWVTAAGAMLPKGLASIHLPGDDWYWTDEWSVSSIGVHRSAACEAPLAVDSDGWSYGETLDEIDVERTEPPRSVHGFRDRARRRAWCRSRVPIAFKTLEQAKRHLLTLSSKSRHHEVTISNLRAELLEAKETLTAYEGRLNSLLMRMADAVANDDISLLQSSSVSAAPVKMPGGRRVLRGGGRGKLAMDTPTPTKSDASAVATPPQQSFMGAIFRSISKHLSPSPSKSLTPPQQAAAGAALFKACERGDVTSICAILNLAEPVRDAATHAAEEAFGSSNAAATEGGLRHPAADVRAFELGAAFEPLPAVPPPPASTAVTVSVDFADEKGRQASHFAANAGSVGALEALRCAGADLAGARDANSRTPLHYAARAGAMGAVTWLLRAGTSPNVQTKYSVTPLHEAVVGKNPGVIRLLLQAGADASIRDGHGLTPADLCRRRAEPGNSAWETTLRAITSSELAATSASSE
jgi:hypothetical protein